MKKSSSYDFKQSDQYVRRKKRGFQLYMYVNSSLRPGWLVGIVIMGIIAMVATIYTVIAIVVPNALAVTATTTNIPKSTTATTTTTTTTTTATTTTSFNACFAKSSLVETEDRGLIEIWKLKRGDRVKTFDPTENKWIYSRFITFIHADNDLNAKYVKVKTATNITLLLSELHFIARLKHGIIDFVYAADLKIGDRLIVEGVEESDQVIELGISNEFGAFAPLTETGTLAVNSIYASSYVHMSSHWVGHYSHLPIIILDKYLGINFQFIDTEILFKRGGDIYWYDKFFGNYYHYIPFATYFIIF